MTTSEQRQRLVEIINAGLVSGLGEAKAGHLCVEAAVCLALGEPHSDRPSCVAGPDRDFAITLNDADWSSPDARAKAMLPLALAQLGTAGTDRTAWVQHLVDGTVKQIVPLALRAAAKVHHDDRYRESLEVVAVCCERDGDISAAKTAADAAKTASYAYAAKAAKAASYADAAAAAAASSYAYAAKAADAAAYTADAAKAATAAAARASAAAAAAAYAASYAAKLAADAACARDDVLRLAVQIALDAYAADGRTQ